VTDGEVRDLPAEIKQLILRARCCGARFKPLRAFPLPACEERDRVRGPFELGQQHLQNTLEVFKYLVVPDPDNAIAKRVQFGITHSVSWTVGMLSAINLDD